MRHITIVFLFFFSLGILTENTSAQAPSPSADSSLFDFWVGHWDLTWITAEGDTAYGTNQIEKILDGQIIQENFEVADGSPNSEYRGKSWSMIDRRTGEWKQTWVDTDGSYLPFTGGTLPDGTPYFGRSLIREGNKVWQRMIFLDIRDDQLTWRWQSSTDSAQWKTNWEIFYERMEPKNDSY